MLFLDFSHEGVNFSHQLKQLLPICPLLGQLLRRFPAKLLTFHVTLIVVGAWYSHRPAYRGAASYGARAKTCSTQALSVEKRPKSLVIPAKKV